MNAGRTSSPSGNRTLSSAKAAKQDEFYTQLPDIANELKHYKDHLRGKVVLCNCASLEPEGYLESELAARLAAILWRLRRVSSYEAQVISVSLERMPDEIAATARYGEKVAGVPLEDALTLENMAMQTGVRMLPGGEALDKIMRYEAHLHRMHNQTLHELEAMQLRRRGGHSPLARLDITGAPQSA